jgi:hypothetical protein
LQKLDIEKMHYEKPKECKQLCGQLKSLFGLVKDDFQLATNVGDRLTSGFQPLEEFHTVKHAPPMHPNELPAFIRTCREYKVRGGLEKAHARTSHCSPNAYF